MFLYPAYPSTWRRSLRVALCVLRRTPLTTSRMSTSCLLGSKEDDVYHQNFCLYMPLIQLCIDAILVKPRVFAFVVAESHTYRAWIDCGWSFECQEVRYQYATTSLPIHSMWLDLGSRSVSQATQTVYCTHQEQRRRLRFVFEHKDEFWLFVRRYAEARIHTNERARLVEDRTAFLQNNFRLFLERGVELGRDTFHSGVKHGNGAR